MNPKTIFLSASFLLAFLLPSKAQEKVTGIDLSPISVTLEEYCAFLNTSATDSPVEPYEEKMNGIVRSGDPGAYRYTVTSGNEQSSVTFMNQLLAAQYEMCSGSASSISLAQVFPTDPALQSNHSVLHRPLKSITDLTEKSSSSDATWKTVLEGAALMGLVATTVVVAKKTKCCTSVSNNEVGSLTFALPKVTSTSTIDDQELTTNHEDDLIRDWQPPADKPPPPPPRFAKDPTYPNWLTRSIQYLTTRPNKPYFKRYCCFWT